jgi:hypothetical protein
LRSLFQNTLIEVERDGAIRIGVRRFEDKRADVHIRIKLFAHLPPQCVGVAFGAVDLASRKFPESGQVNAVGPSRDKKRVVLFNDGGDDDDGGSQ